jgi:chorismate-pyruvate lyase
MSRRTLCLLPWLSLSLTLSIARADAVDSAWTSSAVARVEALALLQTLNAELLSHDSATATLEHWCDAHRLASPPRIAAVRISVADKPPSPEQRQELAVTPAESVRYRKVRLTCGSVVLSEAENWYVPSRLTPEMNQLLETTDMPFGKVVRTLHFSRHTLSSTLLWSPLPEGWEMNAATSSSRVAAAAVPPFLLQHRAVLMLPNGTPFSEVEENYTRQVLGFPAPSL